MKRLGWLLLAICFAAPLSAAPNIVLILMDDLGWSDVGCNGSEFYRTPNIDLLAARGTRFTQAYAACPVCSPTRASILTGQYPGRLHLTDWLPGRADNPRQKLLRPQILQQLPTNLVTLARALKKGGYSTASIGKWHLGGSPLDAGFDVNIAGDHRGSPPSYFYPYRDRSGKSLPGLEKGEEGEYLTDRLTSEAENFIEGHRAEPFFLYLAHYAVHIPLGAPAEAVKKHLARTSGAHQTNAVYAAMVEKMDESVGRLMRKVKDLGLEKNTIFVFTSDNGGLSVKEGPNTPATSNYPFRAGKGYLHEGGIRVPLIVAGPGIVRSVSDRVVSSVDLFPTILALSNIKESSVDGVDFSPVLKGSTLPERPAAFWHYPHYSNQGGKPGGAVRLGDYKLIERYEDGGWELFNLRSDPTESHNLASEDPKRAAQLAARLDAWRRAAAVQMPRVNGEYVGTE